MAVMTRMISMKEVHSVRSGRSFPETKLGDASDHENSLKDGKASTDPPKYMNPHRCEILATTREGGGQSYRYSRISYARKAVSLCFGGGEEMINDAPSPVNFAQYTWTWVSPVFMIHHDVVKCRKERGGGRGNSPPSCN